jgi:uncharacterized protein YeaO (DUF488 family)
MKIKVKRVYDPVERGDGKRVLVDRLWPRGIAKKNIPVWMKEIAPSNALRNWYGHKPGRWPSFRAKYRRELAATKPELLEAELAVWPVSQPVAETSTESASPACYANKADDTYMGYASRDELLTFLNELLEAERAGARVTKRTASEFGDAKMKSLMQDIYRDEARWCAMLLKWVKYLDGDASPRVGAFYEKCMAISDLPERTVFLNRGQGWVVRKLREMLPKVRDNAMHADFSEMLRSHEENIARANDALK